MRRQLLAVVVVALMSLAGSAIAQSENVALQSNGGTATAINYGTYMGDPQYPWEAIDGNPNNGWSSNWSCPAWLKVEFDQVYEIDTVAWWTGSHRHTYSISLSSDNSTWTTVVPSRVSTNIEGAAPTYASFSIPHTDAKYIKIDITSTSAPGSHIFQSSVGELEAFTTIPQQQNVVLAFDNDLTSRTLATMRGDVGKLFTGSQYTSYTFTESQKQQIADGVSSIFQGYNVHVTTGSPVSNATVVSFLADADNDGGGLAYKGGFDRFNKTPSGEAAVFIPTSYAGITDNEDKLVQYATLVAAHEVGHTLGLTHVDPSGSSDIMAPAYDPYRMQAGEFRNEVSDATNLLNWGKTHNPVYHLLRYTAGYSDTQLRLDGINPGSYDIKSDNRWWQTYIGNPGNVAMTLYDVQVLAADPGTQGEVVAEFAEITLEDLSQIEFEIPFGAKLSLIGASSPGGEWDTFLGAGDLSDINNAFVDLTEDGVLASLQYRASDGTFSGLADVSVEGTVVPEPASFGLLALGGLALLRRRRAG
ncbi:MAG: discoidin domain-containing protein [Phycisphaerae bacterium]|nr:discoidin domain-containing protein [Phycisphaerae bacterium]